MTQFAAGVDAWLADLPKVGAFGVIAHPASLTAAATTIAILLPW